MDAIPLHNPMPSMDGPVAPTSEASDSSCYMSAPNSPAWVTFLGTTTATAAAATTTDSDSDDFAFEISLEAGHIIHYSPPWPHKELEPCLTTSSADGLLGNDVAWPLRPPTQLEITSPSGATQRALCPVEHGSFSGLSAREREFDPFLATMDHVRRESNKVYMDPNSSLSHCRTQYSGAKTGKSKPDKRGAKGGVRRATGHVRSSSESERPTGKSTKQRIKDLFLFRSASAGRADTRDKLQVHTGAIILPNRAVSLRRRRTRLPYKQSGFFGCFTFCPK